MADANDKLSNLDPPTAINADLLPGTDNNIELGSSTKRWKKLYLRADSGTAIEQYKDGASPAKVLELDYRGLVRDQFSGEAELTDDDLADIGTPDSLGVQFMPGQTGLDDDNFRVQATGQGAVLVQNQLVPPTKWRVYAFWHAPYPIISAYHNMFTAWVTFTAYLESDNSFVTTTNNWKAMAAALDGISESLPANLGRVHWLVTWPL